MSDKKPLTAEDFQTPEALSAWIESQFSPEERQARAVASARIDEAMRWADYIAAKEQADAIEDRRAAMELRYKQAIEKYNRAHGQNPKITLKAITAQLGLSYDAVRQYRSRTTKRKAKK